jgi:TPP-dependent pyruvate/acetoin dehydrogenase alpha subunit
MLTEETKLALGYTVALYRHWGMIDKVTKVGPVKFIQAYLTETEAAKDSRLRRIQDNVRENLAEAERYAAGLLGMC